MLLITVPGEVHTILPILQRDLRSQRGLPDARHRDPVLITPSCLEKCRRLRFLELGSSRPSGHLHPTSPSPFSEQAPQKTHVTPGNWAEGRGDPPFGGDAQSDQAHLSPTLVCERGRTHNHRGYRVQKRRQYFPVVSRRPATDETLVIWKWMWPLLHAALA